MDKYIGDGVLAQFVAGGSETQARAALACVKAVYSRLSTLNQHRVEAGQPTVRVTMALHAGDVLVGVFDDGNRAEFTVLGPAMNMLARIESRAKANNLTVAASEDFLDILSKTGSCTNKWNLFPSSSADVYQLLALFTINPEKI